MIYQKLEYLHFNPVAAGFVAEQEDWLYSSARTKGVLEITMLEPLSY